MRASVLLALLTAPVLIGCGADKKSSPGDKSNPAAEASASVPGTRMNAAHVLIQFQGCQEARPDAPPRAEALKIAQEVAQKARAGTDFEELAREYSDDSTAAAGGNLGNFFPSQLKARQFTEALSKLEIDEISDPVESPLGYHVIRRREVEKTYNASHILLLHTESQPEPAGIERTREQALAVAEDILKRAKAGDSFNELAVKHSDGPARREGGQMGNFTLSQLPSYFAKVGQVAAKLDVGEVSDVFETEVGVHLVKRQEIPAPPRVFSAKHILVQYRGAERAVVTRSKAEALEIIKLVRRKLAAGEKFESLARDYSDGPSAPDGGDLGSFSEKRMVPAFSKATGECPVGGYTDIVESPFGYHIIYRYK